MNPWRCCIIVWLLGSVPAHHQRDHPEPHIQRLEPSEEELHLYSHAGEIVATCDEDGDHLSHCKILDGYTLDDVMAAWKSAYEEKGQ
jgi:hypothetical protein